MFDYDEYVQQIKSDYNQFVTVGQILRLFFIVKSQKINFISTLLTVLSNFFRSIIFPLLILPGC